MREHSDPDRHQREVTAVLGALALFLSTIEYLIPKPLPFIRIGLANLPILLSLSILSPRDIFLLVLLKIFGQGLINGTLFSYAFLFSTGGSFVSAGVMLLLHRIFKNAISPVGLSVAGALGSNLTQLLLARLLIIGPSTMLIAPPLLGIGLVSSLLLGFFAASFQKRSKWYRTYSEKSEWGGRGT